MSTTCFGATKSAGRGRGRGRGRGGAILWDSVTGRVLKAHIPTSCFHECFLMVPLKTLISCIFGYAWASSFDRKCIWYPVKAATRLQDKVIGVSGRRMTGGVVSGGMVGKIDPGRKNRWMKLTEGSGKCSKKLRHRMSRDWWDWLEFSLRLEMYQSVSWRLTTIIEPIWTSSTD